MNWFEEAMRDLRFWRQFYPNDGVVSGDNLKWEGSLLPYLAGLFDGEGTIAIGKQKPVKEHYNAHYSVIIKVAMCDKPSVELFRLAFGGNVIHQEPVKATFNESWVWYLRSSESETFLREMIPYLILKKPHAEIALHYLTELRTLYGIPTGAKEDVRALREAQYILLQELNKRGVMV